MSVNIAHILCPSTFAVLSQQTEHIKTFLQRFEIFLNKFIFQRTYTKYIIFCDAQKLQIYKMHMNEQVIPLSTYSQCVLSSL